MPKCGQCGDPHPTAQAVRACYDEYYAYLSEVEAEPTPRAFCDVYTVHEPHTYLAINTNVYACPGFSAQDLVDLEALENAAPCEHGLSAHLCNGPNHYETYEQERARAGF